MIRKWDIKDAERRRKCIDEVIARIQDIDDPEAVGVVVAQDIIDIVMEYAGPEIYNSAIDDVMKIVTEKAQDLEYATDELKQI